MARQTIGFLSGSAQLPTDNIYFTVATEEADRTATQFQQHNHNFYEILFIRKGSPQYRIGNERFQLEPGDLIFVPPGTTHSPVFTKDDRQTYHRDILWFSKEFARTLHTMLPEEGFQGYGLLRTHGSSWHFVENCFQKGIQEMQQQKPGWKAMLHANTLELMTHLYRAFLDSQSIQPPSEKPQLLDEILAYVDENLSSRITLSETAKLFYISESTISGLFRREMGLSFYRCVTQRRLIASQKLILEGQPLDEVSRKVGFGDYSSFYRAFKGEYGISPKQLREKNG